jgi:chemotaxis protein CheZ
MHEAAVSGGRRTSRAFEGLEDRIEGAIRDSVVARLDELRRFVDRRFAELSAEIHASATLAEMTEATLAGQIGRVQQEVARMVSVPVSGARSTGLELEAVVQGTEVAANQILAAAEAISDWVGQGAVGGATQEITQKIQTIFEACSFQDLTSQRIRRAIQHLEQVDIMLNNIVAAEPQPAQPLPEGNFGGTGADLDQSRIDQLLAG